MQAYNLEIRISSTVFERLKKSLKHKTDAFNFGSRYFADENNYLREYNRNFTIKFGYTPSQTDPKLFYHLGHSVEP